MCLVFYYSNKETFNKHQNKQNVIYQTWTIINLPEHGIILTMISHYGYLRVNHNKVTLLIMNKTIIRPHISLTNMYSSLKNESNVIKQMKMKTCFFYQTNKRNEYKDRNCILIMNKIKMHPLLCRGSQPIHCKHISVTK